MPALPSRLLKESLMTLITHLYAGDTPLEILIQPRRRPLRNNRRRRLLRHQVRPAHGAVLHEHRQRLRSLDVHLEHGRADRRPARTPKLRSSPTTRTTRSTIRPGSPAAKTVISGGARRTRRISGSRSLTAATVYRHPSGISTRTSSGNRLIFEEINHDLEIDVSL